ncbi:class I SAM-dependent DNA methyltransferase [Parasedimentitalea psychrophila]|uniref:Methyltransferase domain-containing protein n=1 Tax=Parasedimentitalea psychrophila TaxID=2997337 RepID=A0A9Y2L1L7_9RHOB|nr:class I SAM-dependent methyltransferase [Parasedimentitalea psychrophila]WIY26483.1 methyltransferase domain-containing protein [Parasedimentitalea psychrophila]
MTDRETMDVYAKAADDYARNFSDTKAIDMNQEADLDAFFARVPKGGLVLDLGCGPGQWAARLRDAGLIVDATDASPEMVQLAIANYRLNAKLATFEQLTVEDHYDGIWANFSLLHASRADFPGHLGRVHRALRPGGTLSIGMKLGSGEHRDSLGRFYAYYREDELRALLTEAGFTVTRSRVGNGKGLAGSDDTFVVMTAHV